MKILLVITGLGVGGAEKLVTNMADEFVGKGHQVVIAFLTGKALLLPNETSIEVIKLDLNSIFSIPKAYLKLRKIVKSFKPDVVHSHLVHANILTRLLRLTIAVPRMISSAHNTNEEGAFRLAAYRATDCLTDLSTNVSEAATAVFIEKRAVSPARIVTVHNGISIEEFCYSAKSRNIIRSEFGIDGDCKLILAVGRLDESKDHLNLLRALEKIKSFSSPFQVLIAGDGPLRELLVSHVEALGLNKFVQFLGLRRDVATLMSAADVFVLSSAWEGFGLVVAEAMACERVVVATDSGGVREVLGDAGCLVPAKDSEALATGLNWALSLSENERQLLGKKARNRVRARYSFATMVEKWLALYRGEGVVSSSETPERN